MNKDEIMGLNITNIIASLSSKQYNKLLTAIWLWVWLVLVLLGVNEVLSGIVGAISQYPSHVLLCRIEFKKWLFY